uniref:Putative secreted protein n=1 Tax=Ixodes ricinus TaxID=34613 RepID=A0A6B0U778_IXORI
MLLIPVFFFSASLLVCVLCVKMSVCVETRYEYHFSKKPRWQQRRRRRTSQLHSSKFESRFFSESTRTSLCGAHYPCRKSEQTPKRRPAHS